MGLYSKAPPPKHRLEGSIRVEGSIIAEGALGVASIRGGG